MAENKPHNSDSRKLPPISPRSLPSPSKPKKKKKAVNKSNGELNGTFSKSPDSDLSPDLDKLPSEEEILEIKRSNRVLPPIQSSFSSPENGTKSEKRKKKKKVLIITF